METSALIRDLRQLLREEKAVYASAEDCDYFRNLYRASKKKIEPPPPAIAIPPPLPPIIQPAPPPRAEIKSKPIFDLQPPPVAKIEKIESFEEIQKICQKVAPDWPLTKEIPSDADARHIAERWKTKNQSAPFSVLSFHEPPAQKLLLQNIAKALDVVHGKARFIEAEPIEQEKQWEAFLSVPELKLVILCDYALWQMPGLLQHYREVSDKRFLLKAPLLLLPDLSLYLKDPLLKRSLWKAICQKIGS